MPLYEYECESCANRFERIQKFSDPLVDVCPSCGGAVKKLLSSPAIQFKGSGWYITDYARKSKSDDSASQAQSASDDSSSASTAASSGDKASPAPAAPATKPDKS
jgi:putative FmdB family regulatory protein